MDRRCADVCADFLIRNKRKVMSEHEISALTELTDVELNAVSGGGSVNSKRWPIALL